LLSQTLNLLDSTGSKQSSQRRSPTESALPGAVPVHRANPKRGRRFVVGETKPTFAGSPESLLEAASRWSGAARHHRRRSYFRLETIDLLTRRVLLLQAGPALVGIALLYDLFGGDGVERSARRYHRTCKAARPGTIEIIVRLPATIKCHGRRVSHVAGG
jgi:hypothetical protein